MTKDIYYAQCELAIKEARKQDMQKSFLARFWLKIYYIIYPLSLAFAKKKTNPNQITLLMAPSALLAAALFASGNIYLILLGSIIIQFFQIFDFCDGKVARATGHITKFGREFDYLMHTICHPFVYLSFFTFIKLTGINVMTALVTVMLATILEATNRSLHNLSDAIIARNAKKLTDRPDYHASNARPSLLKELYRNISLYILSFPYYMCITPFVFLINYFFVPKIPLTFFWIILHIGYNLLNVLNYVIHIYLRCWKEI